MKKYLIAILLALPLAVSAQDNTWERIEVEPVEKENPDAKYLAENAVPLVDGKVVFQTVIKAPGKSADQIYDILLKQLEKMVQEPNQIENSVVALQDRDKHELAAVFHEWLVFKNSALALDRTQFNFQLHVLCSDGQADVSMARMSYDYDLDRKPTHYTAEEWITDKYAVNKKHTKLYPISAKFRRKTIDRKDFIFKKFESLLNDQK
jgi:colicin import membrane protein